MKYDKRLASREGSLEHLEWLKGYYLEKIKNTKDKKALAEEIAYKIASLEQEAIRDRLTGAFNRGFVGAVLGLEVELVGSYGHSLGLVMLDIDYFKSINDEEPDKHLAGDRTLIELVKLLREVCGSLAIVGRWGGEEFVVVVPNVSGENLREMAVDVGHSVGGWLAQRAKLVRPKVTVSMGGVIASGSESGTDLMIKADKLLYKAKESGRARLVMDVGGEEVVVKFG